MERLLNTPMRRPNPLDDYFFYKVMGEKGDEVQLLGFLNAVLGRTGDNRFTSVKILENKTFTPETVGDKSVTFDIRAVLQDKTRVNVEVQLRNQHNMDKRSLFYWSKEFVKSLKSGEDYQSLPDVIAINIVDFSFPPSKNYHTCFHLWEDREKDLLLTNSLEIHYVNMVQYRRTVGSKVREKDFHRDPLCRWLAWFNLSSSPELIVEVEKMDGAILAAADRLEELLADEDAVRAVAPGLEAHLIRMKAIGRPEPEIAEITGLSPEIVQEL
jgi:predicted transposase/invertase (TIGR01784 family)